MTDRRPENLYAKDREDWRGDTYRSASPADLLAVVRRGVESGTIEGEVEWRCRVHHRPGNPRWCQSTHAHVDACEMAEVLIVSDGGEDRP